MLSTFELMEIGGSQKLPLKQGLANLLWFPLSQSREGLATVPLSARENFFQRNATVLTLGISSNNQRILTTGEKRLTVLTIPNQTFHPS
jgi:hypothetical protein